MTGNLGNLSGQFNWEYAGPYYQVIGNSGAPKDREGFSLSLNYGFNVHSFTFNFSRYNDNVKHYEIYPRTYNTVFGVNYNFSGIEKVSLSLGFQRDTTRTTDEPEFTPHVHTDTDTYSANLSYTCTEKISFGMQGSYSIQDDRVERNGSETGTITFSPSYSSEHFNFTPSISFNRTKYENTDEHTDTATLTLDTNGDLFDGRIIYELASSYVMTKASDNTIDEKSLDTHIRVGYVFQKDLWYFGKPFVGFRVLYRKGWNKVDRQKNDELVLLFVISTIAKASF